MYRLLRADDEVHERRRQATHPAAVKPELLATQPNQVWSWDITKLLGPAKWTYYYLYVVLDIYSRYVTGWLLAERESAALAEQLLAETIRKEGIAADQLTIHADRGASMASKPVALLLADLGVTKSHSRPHVSNDNPTRRRSSRRSSTARTSQIASARSRRHRPSAACSSAGTTTSTAILGSATTRRLTSIMAAPSRSISSERRSSRPPTLLTLSASFVRSPSRRLCRSRPGSTHHWRYCPLPDCLSAVSHRG
jgi:putative transposase